MRAKILLGLVAAASFGSGGLLSVAYAQRPIAMKKAATKPTLEREYCTRLFEREWTTAIGTLSEPVARNGFRFGIGTKMSVEVDGKMATGTFLGRLVDAEYKTTNYMFEDYAGRKNYLIDPAKAELRFAGQRVADKDLQVFAETLEQRGDTCSVFAIENYFSQLVVSRREGNGELRKAFESPLGHADLRQTANDYYIKGARGGNFEPILRELGEKYGYKCRSLKPKDAMAFATTVLELLDRGVPVLLEFFIGYDMVSSDRQWVNTQAKVGEDLRFWAPRGVGQRSGGGHAIVSVETFTSASGQQKLLISDSDWNKRPVVWDYDKYFSTRIKSSGMLAHYCEDLPVTGK